MGCLSHPGSHGDPYQSHCLIAGNCQRHAAARLRVLQTTTDANSGSDDRTATHRFCRLCCCVAVVFIAVSLISVPIPGVNESHYLTKARAFADSSWCQNDFFLQSSNAHFVFYALTGPLTRVLPFAVVAIIGRLISLTVLACGWVMVSRRLKLSASAAVLSAAAFCGIAMTGNLSGEWVIGGFEGKVPSWGFALIGIALWFDALKQRRHSQYLQSGLVFGLSVSFHPVVGIWCCIGIAVSELLLAFIRRFAATEAQTIGVKHFVTNGVVFALSSIVLALPGLIPAVMIISSKDLDPAKADRANYIQVFWRLAHHLDPSTFPVSAWIHTAILLVTTMAALVVARWFRINVSGGNADEMADVGLQSAYSGPTAWRPLIVLLTVAMIISVIGTFIGWHTEPVLKLPDWQWRGTVLKFYPFRFFDALLPITAALSIGWLTDKITRPFTRYVRTISTVVLWLIVLNAAFLIRPQAPASYSVRSYTEWQRACDWIRGNTDSDALILGPREAYGLKWYAERAEYVCFKDCPQDAEGILEWNERLWTIHRWSQKAYQDRIFDRGDLRTLHEQTGITHILTRQLGPFEQDPVYENDDWRIYETR